MARHLLDRALDDKIRLAAQHGLDLFIVTHPEYMPGTQQRFDSMYESALSHGDVPFPEDRAKGEMITRFTGIYPREIAHRKQPRKSFRSTRV